MARRRRQHEEHENLERWLVSYADFITLLFAFFVVMYSISSVNEGKYRVLSETLSAVFNVAPSSDQPIQVGERPRDILPAPDAPLVEQRAELNGGSVEDGEGEQANPSPVDPDSEDNPRIKKDAANALRVADEIAISLQDYVDRDLLKISHLGDRIEIEMKEQMLFSSGEARLSRSALSALRQISQTLNRIPSYLQIQGHTDDVPISTAAFPSNWELSAARAASVVHFLARSGIQPQRMAAVGMGEFRPIAGNDSAKGRAANRRVTIVVLTGQSLEQNTPDEDLPWAEAPALEIR